MVTNLAGRAKYIMVLIHGGNHLDIVARAWVGEADEEQLSKRLHDNVLADLQKVYQPLGESIEKGRIETGKGVKATKSRGIAVEDMGEMRIVCWRKQEVISEVECLPRFFMNALRCLRDRYESGIKQCRKQVQH
jgi:chorismate-pyruvate lyase